ncbi:hypothetical protein VOLCADRAFT_92471 [Volvox carteri f. nagariensis]|uniref:PPPDE domain-containing protein n=1 Tax=Volvox carteri f. nagariensis TaxID=3068 RepID=D8TZR3_VOLCA|nr:uncharacterized protein VOLCADRAFT_92471 [Volvox carteri f. nagariensis]EFJ46967.1 hypothetical protein VOLCADRAFT_92471 [Volvox carteri f. nagariensis]|eukprot:XP_002951862.1 hypothetical protein VOLCADRAFT_92471 [Volvox carteri f. nagariensis]
MAHDRTHCTTCRVYDGTTFHGAVQLEDLEWSFGYCESGTGVYCCRARSNSLYTFREHIELGATRKTKQEVRLGTGDGVASVVAAVVVVVVVVAAVVAGGGGGSIREILSRFKRAWPGSSYDLLQRNCCHFCEDLCLALEVPSPPAWLNRFAQGADATVKFTNEASALTSALTAAQQGGASRSPPPSAAAAATPAQQQQQQSAAGQSSPLAAALRQKWLELEASAGDGTKQFLLGLVKTRQTRLAEEEEVASPAGAGGSYSAAAEGGQTSRSPRSEGGRDVWPVTTATHGSHGMMAYAGPLSVAPAAAAAAAAAVHDESTRPPALQLISHSLMSPDVLVGASGLSAAAAAASTAVVGVEAGVVSAESPAAAAGAESPPTSGSTGPRATASASASVTQARHLLDM